MDKGEDVMAKYVNKTILMGGLYTNIHVVDLFVRQSKTAGNDSYPIVSLDFLKGDRRFGLVFTLPVLAITIGYVMKPLKN